MENYYKHVWQLKIDEWKQPRIWTSLYYKMMKDKIHIHTPRTMDDWMNSTPTKIVKDHYIEVDNFNWWQPYYNAHIPIWPKHTTPTTTNTKVLVYHRVASKIPQSNSSGHMNGK